jgi:uncharacterized phage protein gp47/JayE
MTGAALDSFVQLFGMSRFPATSASGTVTFTRQTATDVISVPVNSQVSNVGGTVVAQTLTAAILSIGQLVATVPVQATVAGAQGNVQANSLTQLMTPVAEISSATNLAALTGGAAQETDSQLQQRWATTVFKSMSGTDAMFLGIALNNPSCTAANVVGSMTSRTEQVQIVSGAASSVVSDAQYVYPTGQIVGQDITGGNVAVPGLQYTWNYSVLPPAIEVIDTSYFPNGQIVTLEFNYLDVWSRNQPSASIWNRVDVWCAGSNPIAATQTVPWSNSLVFSSSGTFNVAKFIRPDGTSPAEGNIFIPLAFGPIVTMDAVISIGSTQYGLATPSFPLGTVSNGISYAYQIVHENDAFGWGPFSNFGLEWVAAMAPVNGSAMSVGSDYTYNNVPAQVQQGLENWRLAATDVIAHQAINVYLQFSVAVIFDPSTTQATATAAIQAALSTWLTGLGFSAVVYPSSVIQQIESVPGIDACRFIVGTDIPGYNGATPDAYSVGIQQLSAAGQVLNSFVDSLGNPVDIVLGASQIPAFGAVSITPKAPNSFGSFV